MTCPESCPSINRVTVPYTFPDRERYSQIMMIGESPGRDEEKEKRPFIGRAGKLLRGAISQANIDISTVVIGNSARCLIDKKNMEKREITAVLPIAGLTLKKS